MTAFKIKDRTIGEGAPVYIVAEISANHHNRFDEAVRLVEVAAECGVDAVKLQTYTADTLTIKSDQDYFKIGKGTLWEGRGLYELYEEAMTPWEWQPKLKKVADDLGIDLFSTPFDETAIDLLEEMKVDVYKVASFEMVDIVLIKKIAATGKPIIMSTGMANLEEITEAVDAARSAGDNGLALLKCTSAYPAPPEEMNLKTIPDLAARFDVVAGLSDHTMGTQVPVAAVALGAKIVEKHFTLSRSVEGPDSAFSLEPHELKEMVASIRKAEAALGEVVYELTDKQQASRVFRRSLFVVADIKAGEPLTNQNIRSIRPGYGLAPKHLDEVLGKVAAQDMATGTPLSWDLIKDS